MVRCGDPSKEVVCRLVVDKPASAVLTRRCRGVGAKADVYAT